MGGLTIYIISSFIGNALRYPTYLDCLSLSFWALVGGDLIGAFLKRRMGLPPRGAPAPPLLDQLDFLVAALLVTRLLDPPAIVSLQVFVAAVLLTPPIHLATNAAAYVLGLKKELGRWAPSHRGLAGDWGLGRVFQLFVGFSVGKSF